VSPGLASFLVAVSGGSSGITQELGKIVIILLVREITK